MAGVKFVGQLPRLRLRDPKLLSDQSVGEALFSKLKSAPPDARRRLFHREIYCSISATSPDTGRLDISMSDAEPSPPPSARPQPTFTNQIPADRRYWVLGVVMLVQFISVLTSTIVSTAAPTIVGELHGLDLYAWLFSSYLLASSVTVPVVGKLSDLFGRRPFYIAGLVLFLIGSAGSGFAQNMGELIVARAVTGIGGGAMMALGATTIGDIFSPRERGRWIGLIISVFGLGSIVGPLVGGFITDHFGWRWVFYVNLALDRESVV